jgi:hypothetical protein
METVSGPSHISYGWLATCLVSLPVSSYWVNMTYVGITLPNGTVADISYPEFVVNAIIDTGSTLSRMHPVAIDMLAELLGAWESRGDLKVLCSLRDKNGTVDFGFNDGKILIRVKYKDFIIKNQDGSCSLGAAASQQAWVLGDTFIRGAYCEYTNGDYG